MQPDFLRGPNPIARVKRRKVRAYAGAVPLAYDDLGTRLAAIDRGTLVGLRDYALLLVGPHTGRRLSELAGLRREHVRIRAGRVEFAWPRCKGGKAMRDVLPRGGAGSEAAAALVAWIEVLGGLAEGGTRSTPARPPVTNPIVTPVVRCLRLRLRLVVSRNLSGSAWLPMARTATRSI
jgi:hypothetical protein